MENPYQLLVLAQVPPSPGTLLTGGVVLWPLHPGKKLNLWPLHPGKKLNYSLHWFALVWGFGVSQKSRNALFGEVPKRRRQLGGTKKLVTCMETGKYAYGDPKTAPNRLFCTKIGSKTWIQGLGTRGRGVGG